MGLTIYLMGKITSVNSGMENGTVKAPQPGVHRIKVQDKNTSVNTRMAISTDRAP